MSLFFVLAGTVDLDPTGGGLAPRTISQAVPIVLLRHVPANPLYETNFMPCQAK